MWIWRLVLLLDVVSKGFVFLFWACVVATVSDSRLHEEYWIFLCPYPTNLALWLQCAMRVLSWGTVPGGLIYGPLPLNSHPAVRKEWNRNYSQWWKLAFLYPARCLPEVIFTLRGPCRSSEGRLQNTRWRRMAVFAQSRYYRLYRKGGGDASVFTIPRHKRIMKCLCSRMCFIDKVTGYQ